jgi:mannose-6-phosphate isomerase-like protein (cupin superfamily)
MELYHLTTLADRQAQSGHPYLEFQRSSALSAGLYVLPAGAVDRQQPHTEDEIYYVVTGSARISVGEEDAAVQPGSVVFVPAKVPHRFHDIATQLEVLVVFGPAEATGAGSGERPPVVLDGR